MKVWPSVMTSFHASLLGGALGDAMGRPTEFISQANAGLRAISLPRPALITDDTQMSLAVASALNAPVTDKEAWPEQRLVRRFAEWRLEADHNGRAPGQACLAATLRMAKGVDWRSASERNSKGCGGVMRAHPVAFIHDTSLRRRVAVLQSAMTHGHPTASISADVWVEIVARAHQGADPISWIDVAWEAEETSATPFKEVGAPGEHRLGSAEVRSALAQAEIALRHWDTERDPCDFTGPGWTAEEAVATSLVIATRYADDPMGGIERAARTQGDSDTLASMVGALLGARHGLSAWPVDIVEQIEQPYLTQIRALSPPRT